MKCPDCKTEMIETINRDFKCPNCNKMIYKVRFVPMSDEETPDEN